MKIPGIRSDFASLDEWLEAILQRQKDIFPRFCFPSKSYYEEYINNIHLYSNEQVISLLRELLIPYTTGYAYKMLNSLLSVPTDSNSYEFAQKALSCEHHIRLLRGEEEWEGLTWIIGMLTTKPLDAVNVLNRYFSVECGFMNDHRIVGISECIGIIEAKFINQIAGKEKILYSLKPREFETLIETLYRDMGYDTVLTKATRDGGKDVIATIKRVDGMEKVYVECKLYKTAKLKPEQINALAGVVSRDRVNRGVLFCTGAVSDQIKEQDPIIDVIDLTEIVLLLNMHLGSKWDKIFINNQDYHL